MTEDKPTIVRYLMNTLQATSYYSNLTSLDYERDVDTGRETVIARFLDDTEKVINVNLDSGKAMIEDILKGLNDGE